LPDDEDVPRVLLTGFCAVPGPRRAGVQLRQVIRSLTAHHTVDLLVVREGEQPYVERQGSVRVLRVPTHDGDLRAQIQAFQRALKRQLDGADYDVVHCRDSWSGIPVLEARSRLGYAVVYDLTRSPLGESALDPDLDAQYGRDEEACLLAADLVLAPTPAAVKALQGRGKPERVMLSPPGVDVDRFDWDDPPKTTVPKLLYTGSIDPGRGVRVLVRAMAAIVREVDARLVLAGPVVSPKFDKALRDGIRELGLDGKIEITGPVDHDEMPALIATSTVCIVPAASDLTPNPTVVYPTKLLEYMACKRAIVAPRRETVSMVVENGREALLFEPGDPIDLARKVLRLLGEPQLRERIAQAAYERVRRDFTASASRRALARAYEVIAKRFAEHFHPTPVDDEHPKVELLADDDFEPTVFEEAPQPPPADIGIQGIGDSDVLSEALASLDHPTSSSQVAAPPSPADETMERTAVPPGARDRDESGPWTVSQLSPAPAPAGGDDWVVTNVAQAVRSLESEAAERGTTSGDDGTPIEGTAATPTPQIPASENAFVAGEIDVPTPAPEGKTPNVEFTAASKLLSGPEPSEPDTGSHTPPLERR
jgi:glycosyltransferase involved in cell wall biosynthesis